MPRSCSSNSTTRIYDANSNISDLEQTISKVMMIGGLNPSNINSVTIDEIVEAVRATFLVGSSNQNDSQGVMQLPPRANPGYEFASKYKSMLLREVRWAWFDYQIAKHVSNI